MKTRKCLLFGKEITLIATKDLAFRKTQNRTCKNYTVYNRESTDEYYVRIHQGCSTCIMVKKGNKVNSSFIYAKEGSNLWKILKSQNK